MSTVILDTITGKSTATTITIGSTPVVSASANSMTIRGEGSAQTSIQQGLLKAWIQMSDSTTNDSFNVGSTTDNGTGEQTMTLSTNMGNDDYCFNACSSDHTNDSRHIFHDGANPSTSAFRCRSTNSSNSDVDSSFQSMSIAGDLA